VPLLLDMIESEAVIGVDVSQGLLDLARETHRSTGTAFYHFDEYVPAGNVDLVYCNGVFHHIHPPERPAALGYVYRSLRPGALFAMWENNPWNPGTRLVMSRIPFDRDAITLTAPEARRLLRINGFEILRTDYLFIFPRLLGCLRFMEPALCRLPLGAQYQVLCRRPLA